MSLRNYQESLEIGRKDPSFYALIMAAMRKADTANTARLKAAWPDVFEELEYRYWSGGGLLPGEEGYSELGDDNLPENRGYYEQD
jgi:hypothetical protein